MGGERTVAESASPPIHGLSLLREEDRWRALWSDEGGLYERVYGAARERPGEGERRLAAPCPGGLAAARRGEGEGALVACLRPGDPDRGRDGAVALYALPESTASDAAGAAGGEARALGSRSPVGRESGAVTLAVAGARAWVGWEDVAGGGARSWVAPFALGPRAGAQGSEAEEAPIPLSPRGVLGGRPSLLPLRPAAGGGANAGAGREAVLAVWPELVAGGQGQLGGHLLARVLPGAVRSELLPIARDGARPELAADARGPLLVFRDRRDRPGLRGHLLRLSTRGQDVRPVGEPLDAIRANEGAAQLVPCGGWLWVLAPRSYGANSTLISVRRVHPEGLRIPDEPEMQIYDYGVRFSLAAAACEGGALHVLAAEQPSTRQPRPRLRAFTLRCRDE